MRLPLIKCDSVIVTNAHSCLRRGLHSRNLLVQRQDIRYRTHRCDSEWVDLAVTLGVVLLDVSELGCAAERLVVPVKVAQPPGRKSQHCAFVVHLRVVLLVEVGVAAADVPDVALEVLYVDGVEADDGCEEADVLLCEAITEVVRTAGLGEVFFCAIQRFEELGDGLLVGFLGTVG